MSKHYLYNDWMPRIILKHKSPEYADCTESLSVQTCEMPGCTQEAEHKAPKHRGLDEHYHFCFEHAKEYNKAWDFFSGMSNKEVEDHMYSSFYGDRPTWKYGVNGKDPYEELHRAARNSYYYGDESYQKQNEKKTEEKRKFDGDNTTPEYEAMALMGLEPPVNLAEIKTRYKILAKKYHPDLNQDNPKAEELLKKINMAYTILKLAFEDYKNLPDHKT